MSVSALTLQVPLPLKEPFLRKEAKKKVAEAFTSIYDECEYFEGLPNGEQNEFVIPAFDVKVSMIESTEVTSTSVSTFGSKGEAYQGYVLRVEGKP